jgi:pimeloyl-ACP methyl ester carboxylesterase
MMLRNGDIGGQKFSKVVGVGYSYGSVQTQALTATLPTALDAVILQGFSGTFILMLRSISSPTNSCTLSVVNGPRTANPLFIVGAAYSIATEVFPDRFSPGELTNGYLVTLAASFFHKMCEQGLH